MSNVQKSDQLLSVSASPFVFCVIFGYCMTFEETASPDKSLFFRDYISLTPECLWYNELLLVSNLNVQVIDGYKYKDLEQVYQLLNCGFMP